MKHHIKYSLLAGSLLSAQGTFAQATLEEIVVTAQFRQETLQDAGIAIDAVSSKKLLEKGITNAYDLSDAIPALTITEGGGISSQLYMRGVGNTANNDYLDPAIIMNYDGVPLARGAGAAIRGFYDLERVEVLKGPQGTLYGKNATGGVINLVPKKPQLDVTEGFINASVGNYSAHDVSGAINIPVGENSAFRLAASDAKHDGYNKDGTNDADHTSFRAQFLTEVNEKLSVRIGMDYADIGGVGGTTAMGRYQASGLANYTFIPSGIDPNEGSDTAVGNAYRQTILAAPGFGFLTPIQDDWFTDAEMKGVHAEINYDTEFGQLTFIPSWRKQEQESMFGHPGFNSGWWDTEAEQKSFEVRLSGDTDGVIQEYLLGAYYFDEDIKGDNTFNQEFVLPLQEYEQKADSKAVFAQLTWKLSDSVRLITGARYTDDHKEIVGQIDNYITFCGGLPGQGFTPPPGSFATGCQIPGNLPHWPTLDTVAEADAWLVDNGWAAAFIPIPTGYLIPLTTGAGVILHDVSFNASDYDKSKATYRLSLERDMAEDSMVYVSVETGYRSGGLQPQTGTSGVYDPEFLDAYTIGSKSRFLDGRLQLNAELFYWDYEDQQISYFTLTPEGVLQNLTDNVGKTTNKGVDVDLQWLAADNTLLTAKVQWLDAKYKDLHFRTGPPRDNINCPFTVVGTQNSGAPALDFDCSNNDAIYSPEWVGQFGIEQTFPMGSMNLIASLDTTWTDDQVTGFNNLPHEFIDDHWVTNANLMLASADDSWSVSAYVRNIEDDAILRSTQSPLLGIATGSYGPERTYGMRVNYAF